MRFAGDGWNLDAENFVLRREDHEIDLEPQALDVLLHLVRHRDRMVPKVELLDEVWGDRFVGDNALATRISQVRRALGDDGRTQAYVRTVHGRGYRFVGRAREVADGGTAESATPDGDAPAGGGVVVGRRGHHDIPAPRTEMIGRERHVSSVLEAIRTDRLVTLVGLGGVGKTTLASEVGRRYATETDERVSFVDLIPVVDDDGIDDAISSVLGVGLSSGQDRIALIDRLGGNRRLLILDNCEHVVDEVASFVELVLDRATEIRVLTTSRLPLGVVGERRIAIEPLPLTSPDGGAIDLLDAVARRWGAHIPDQHRPAAVALCTRIDGLPLAIELVGAQLSTMSVPDVVARLDALVGTRSRDRRSDRHASLTSVLSDTLGMLTPDERRLLRLLGRISGPFEVADVETLADVAGIADAGALLASLLDRSLVSTSPHADGATDLRVLETVRQHVRSDDDDSDATADLHAGWCLDVVGDTLHAHYYDLALAGWKARRYPDIVAAEHHLVARGRTHDAALLRASTGLMMHFDAGTRASRALVTIDERLAQIDDHDLICRLHCTGVLAAMAARAPAGLARHGDEAVLAADAQPDPSLRALARVLRTWSDVIVDPPRAFVDLDEALELARSVDDVETAALALGYTVLNLAMARRFEEAVRRGEEAFAECGHRNTYPTRTVAQGLICSLLIDDPERALGIDSQMRSRTRVASPWGMDITKQALLASLGRFDDAHRSLVDLNARLVREGVDPFPDVLLVPAVAAHRIGDPVRAARYLGAIRHAGRPTQSLMVSVCYRALRDHVTPADASDLQQEPRTLADDAIEWLGTAADSAGDQSDQSDQTA